MRIGVDYYPEQWSEKRWKIDFELMNKANIKVVRIGEFTWSLYEPQEGVFDFSWMDKILSMLEKYNISAVLCTPSATPPKWMIDKYPQILQEDVFGRKKLPGTRKHYCFNSSIYRQKCHILNSKIAERYGKNPAVEAWQIDNELGWANTTRCYCDECQREFRKWLAHKFKTINELNIKYGTQTWSQIYNSFDEVMIPKAGTCYETDHETQGQNPGLLLDYYRFCSDSVCSFVQETCDDIRAFSNYPITTNMLDANVNSGTGIDYFRLSRLLDFTAWDNYIEFQWGIAEDAAVSRDHALVRGYKKQPFWVMEQQAGACGWSKMGPTPTPGKLRLWTYSAVANGADTVVYFRWRTALSGLEEYWHGILNHDGVPGRRYEEISKTGKEFEKLSLHLGKLMPKAEVAIIKSFDCEWSQSIHSHVEGFKYDDNELNFYRALYRLGISVDFVRADQNLSKYKFVIAPAMVMVSNIELDSIASYVRNGGCILLTYRSGIKDENNAMLPQAAPGVFTEMTGIIINDYDPLMNKQTNVSGVFGDSVANIWSDIIDMTSAHALGVYTSDFYSGKPCLTENMYGDGKVFYMGCDLDKDAMLKLMIYFDRQLDLHGLPYEIKGVESVETSDGKSQIRFILNHNEYPVIVPVERRMNDMLTKMPVDRSVYLEPWGISVLKE